MMQDLIHSFPGRNKLFLCFIVPAFLMFQGECRDSPLNPELQDQLDNVYSLIRRDSISIYNRKARIEVLSVIQKACSKVPARIYYKYMRSWEKNSALADSLESSYEALHYLRKSIQNAIEEIDIVEIEQGVVIWHFYNMGYVFKTKNSCFGIDIHCRDAEQLEKHLDFLLITHHHHDHFSPKLIDAMLNVDKPVITRRYKGSITVRKSREFKFGSVRVKVDIGDHHRHLPLISTNNMLMFQVDCEDEAGNYTIYHSGDGNGIRKMIPDRDVDILIVHVQLPMPLKKAVNRVNPKITLVSHVMELSHSGGFPMPMRWSYDYAFRKMKDLEEEKAIVLSWGEKWLFPGTRIVQEFK